MVVHVYRFSTPEAEAGGLSSVQGKPGLHSEFTASQNYIVNIVLFKKQNKTNKIRKDGVGLPLLSLNCTIYAEQCYLKL